MKKTFSALVLAGLVAVLLVPQVALAQEPPHECCTLNRTIKIDDSECAAGTIAAPSVAASADCEGTGWCNASENKWGMFCLMNTLYSITDWIFVIMVGLAGIFIIIGAMTLLTAAGAPDKVTSGRNYIMYAAIGLVVGFLAKAIPNLVRMISGM
jgi:hypothetical protein